MKWKVARTRARPRSSWESSLGERSALAQAADSRLGETATILLEGFTNSRLGESVSPGQDSSSLKNIAPRLGERSSRNLGEFPLISPRRDELAWARISVLPPPFHACSTSNSFITTPRVFAHYHNQHTITMNTKQNHKHAKSELKQEA